MQGSLIVFELQVPACDIMDAIKYAYYRYSAISIHLHALEKLRNFD